MNFRRRALSLAAAGAVVIGLLVAAPAHAAGTSPIEVVHQQFTGRNAVAFVTDLPADFDQRTPNTAYYAIDFFAADNSDSPSVPFVSIGVRYMHTDDMNVMHDDDAVAYSSTDGAVVDIAEGLTSGHVVGTFTYKTVFHPDGIIDLVDLPAPVTVTGDSPVVTRTTTSGAATSATATLDSPTRPSNACGTPRPPSTGRRTSRR